MEAKNYRKTETNFCSLNIENYDNVVVTFLWRRGLVAQSRRVIVLKIDLKKIKFEISNILFCKIACFHDQIHLWRQSDSRMWAYEPNNSRVVSLWVTSLWVVSLWLASCEPNNLRVASREMGAFALGAVLNCESVNQRVVSHVRLFAHCLLIDQGLLMSTQCFKPQMRQSKMNKVNIH